MKWCGGKEAECAPFQDIDYDYENVEELQGNPWT